MKLTKTQLREMIHEELIKEKLSSKEVEMLQSGEYVLSWDGTLKKAKKDSSEEKDKRKLHLKAIQKGYFPGTSQYKKFVGEKNSTMSSPDDFMQALLWFWNYWTPKMFDEIFGEDDGEWMLKKFKKYNKDILKFYGYLDSGNRELFNRYLF